MTATRENADLAARYFADNRLKCWSRDKDSNGRWYLIRNPLFNNASLEYYVGHKPPPPGRCAITLTVNGKEWNLPKPLTDTAPRDFYYISEANTIKMGFAKSKYHGEIRTQIEQNGGSVYATEADAQAWVDFNKWCRGGGV